VTFLYEAFEPKEARRIAKRLEIHYTLKHDIWLNIAEIELSILTNQCPDYRIPDLSKHWGKKQRHGNENAILSKKGDWQFTTTGTRIKTQNLSTLNLKSKEVIKKI
jgi:hypothetical protein